jgi:hypothetical protein
MMFILGFDLEFTTTYDLVRHINRTLAPTLDAIPLELKPGLLLYLDKILVYLSKMCAFSHHLVTRHNATLASAIYFIALKTLEQVNKNLCPEDLLPDISAFTTVP